MVDWLGTSWSATAEGGTDQVVAEFQERFEVWLICTATMESFHGNL